MLATRTGTRAALWLVLLGLATAASAVHLACSVYGGYENRHWDDLAPRKAAAALGTAVSSFEGLLDGAARSAAEVAGARDSRGCWRRAIARVFSPRLPRRPAPSSPMAGWTVWRSEAVMGRSMPGPGICQLG